MEKKLIKGIELADKEFEVQEDGSLRIVEKKGKFIPNLNEEYWYIAAFGSVCNSFNRGSSEDEFLLKHFPVFRTEEECKEYKRFIDLLDEYSFEPDWKNRKQEKWCLFYNFEDCCIGYESFRFTKTTEYYFESEEKAVEFIEKVGKDNVKKFMFDVWD